MVGHYLTDTEVREIFENTENLRQVDIAEMYGVHKSTVSGIWTRKTHRNVTRDLPDKKRTGNRQKLKSLGEKHPRAKLTNTDVIDIWKSKKSQDELAHQYGVTTHTIYYILRGTTWSYLTTTLGEKGGGCRERGYSNR